MVTRTGSGAGSGRGGEGPPGRPPHLAGPLEERPVLDDELRGDEGGLDLRAGEELDALTSVDAAGDGPPYRDDAAVDLRLHLPRLADDERVVGHDLALQPSVDAHRVAEAQLPQELRPLVHEPVQVLARGEALDLDHRLSVGRGTRLGGPG